MNAENIVFDAAGVIERMAELRMSVRDLAAAAGMRRSTCHRAISNGRLPVRDPGAAQRILHAVGLLHAPIEAGTRAEGDAGKWDGFGTHSRRFNEVGRNRANGSAPDATPAAADAVDDGHSHDGSDLMLIRKAGLTQAARDYWKLFPAALAAPWSREQVFLGGEMRVAYEHMLSKARFGGLLALVGESGSGKTTLKDALVGDLVAEGDIVVIEPHTQRMEENDTAGKTLKGADICAAILREIAPAQKICRTAEAQLNQVAAALAASLAASRERRHLLVIDEAHSLPKPTLRHLKRFLEMKNPRVRGLQRPMLSIVLLGQPELALRLSPLDQTVREVWQRCEVVHLRPLDRSLAEYVKFRLGDASSFAPDAIARLAECLTDRQGVSYQYPIAIDSWLAEILNAMAGLAKIITAEQVAEVFADVRRRYRREG